MKQSVKALHKKWIVSSTFAKRFLICRRPKWKKAFSLVLI
jgi:hypothetical protein